MAKFRDPSQSNKGLYDRVAKDRQSHREAIQEAIRNNLAETVREIDLFKTDHGSGKKYKVPIKLKQEFMFMFDETRGDKQGKGVGQKAWPRKGQVVGKASEQMNKGVGEKAGNQPGEMILELSAEDLDYVLDQIARDLNLPFLSTEKRRRIKVKKQTKWRGIKEGGIEPRLDLEETFLERIKREKVMRPGSGESRSGFLQDDLRYHGLGTKKDHQTNVLVVAIMDISGSMDKDKKYWAKAFLYALYWLTKMKYENSEIIFIAHHTEAEETDSHSFFLLTNSGGTKISSGPEKASQIIAKRYPPSLWDTYIVHCSDGENSSDDDPVTVNEFRKLLKVSRLVGFIEIKPGASTLSTTSGEIMRGIKDKRMRVLLVNKKSVVRQKLEEFLRPDADLSRRMARACAA